MFEITLLRGQQHLEVRITNVDLSLVNGIRRVIMSDIQNVGFPFDASYHGDHPPVLIHTNNTPLHNEFIMHRISMIPVCASMEEIDTWDTDRYRFEIDRINQDATPHLPVTSAHIRVYDNEAKKYDDAIAKRLFPACPITGDHILITKLNSAKNSRFYAEMRAEVHPASTNASFGMVSTCCFGNTIDPEAAQKARRSLEMQNNELEEDEKKALLRKFDHLDVQRKFHVNKYKEPCSFDFVVHSECAVSASEIFTRAFTILADKIERIAGDDVGRYQLEADKMYSVTIENAGHTEGNIVQSVLISHLMRDDNPNEIPAELLDVRLSYIGYTVPHPSDNVVMIKFVGKRIDSVDSAQRFVRAAARYVADHIRSHVAKDWIKTYAKYKK